MNEPIRVGFQAFLADGAEVFGAIRDISSNGRVLTLYVENAGDFLVPIEAVASVHSEKVIFDWGKLDAPLRRAIGHAHDAESE